jgi:hypothetical protein
MGVRRHGESALEGCLRSIQKAWRRRIPGKGRTQEVDRTWHRQCARTRRRRTGLAAAGAAALITPTAVTASPAAAAMRLPAGQAAGAGLAAVATAAWPGASRQALAGPRSQLPVFVLDKGQFRAFDIPFGEFGGDSVTINDRGQLL